MILALSNILKVSDVKFIIYLNHVYGIIKKSFKYVNFLNVCLQMKYINLKSYFIYLIFNTVLL